eukprot:CAMPEP_0198291906 /NCGR_PEP_ID=MMETSP1449-20131203/9256_1 /TAXON_ID=420275 /ORGANISM="Attheya septentrionalis, Strain CCMP2084" /LENGTH=988 /DNA_ID=CAMNT_0043990591 /DNA_START=144 /DNA_END=3107 /DNA_ORIENTATION=-
MSPMIKTSKPKNNGMLCLVGLCVVLTWKEGCSGFIATHPGRRQVVRNRQIPNHVKSNTKQHNGNTRSRLPLLQATRIPINSSELTNASITGTIHNRDEDDDDELYSTSSASSSSMAERLVANDTNSNMIDGDSSNKSSSIFDWAPSMGSFLLQRKQEEELELETTGTKEEPKKSKPVPKKTSFGTGRVEIIDMTLHNATANATTNNVPLTKPRPARVTKPLSPEEKELAKELDQALVALPGTRAEIMKEIKVLPMAPIPSRAAAAAATEVKKSIVRKRPWFFSQSEKTRDESHQPGWELLRNLDQNSDKIARDMQHLAVSIASNVDSTDKWRLFCNDGGGLSPLLECIREGANSVAEGRQTEVDADGNVLVDDLMQIPPQEEESFLAACTACRALRDICALSPSISAVITEGILRADAASAMRVPNSNPEAKAWLSGGYISNLVTLLRHANEAEVLQTRRQSGRREGKHFRRREMVARRKSRRNRKQARHRSALYIVQLLLAMTLASDAAVNTLRSTVDLKDAVLACSSYGRLQRTRRWIRYPVEVLKRIFLSNRSDVAKFKSRSEVSQRPFIAAARVGDDLTGKVQGASNQVLAAIGHNQWVPKIPGQKGLRILCLDGGGTRGITAITTLRSIVNAMGGIEVCDSFDIIAGTSTGAIIAFLVGLRRETSVQARKRYNALIKRIFVKSALSTPMLLFTTAAYDEGGFMEVMQEILGDTSMLDSRADPSVPLVFAVSSKMSTPTQLCLFRNYNYGGGELPDTFVTDPENARNELGLQPDKFNVPSSPAPMGTRKAAGLCPPRGGDGSRHPGSFRIKQKVALRATTAAPTVFKPVMLGGDLYCDGGIVASNPTAVAIHEARALFPDIPIEMVVSCGTGGFLTEKTAPKIGWDGIIAQIVQSATDGEQTHYVLEDILGQGGTAQLGRSSVSQTRYYRLNPTIGMPDDFPIDGTDPERLEELSKITSQFMEQPEQKRKLKEIGDILKGKRGW